MRYSINQISPIGAMPNFCQWATQWRILLAVHGLMAFMVFAYSANWQHWGQDMMRAAQLVEPFLAMSMIVLAGGNRVLQTLHYSTAVVAVLLIELFWAIALHLVAQRYWGLASESMPRMVAVVLLVTALLLFYFHLLAHARSPAVAEARLQALQARIRPHFLFNSITAVLSLIRKSPQRAEVALEDMASLFRQLMADNLDLVPIAKEIELCRQYLDLEQLRLGERLQIEWRIQQMPADALIPPLALQPLLENAVYHGIEPAEHPGVVVIDIYSVRDRLHMILRNPYQSEGSHHGGNKMAVANIRERLFLHFERQAEMVTRVGENTYEVRMSMPYVRGKQ